MNEEINQVIEEKFTRCPECRSFSVKQSKALSLKEKIKRMFVPVTVFLCENCSNRFVEYGSLSEGLKRLFHSLTSTFPRKCVAVSIPLIVVAVLVTILLMAGGKEKEPVPVKEKKPIHAVEKKPKETGKKEPKTAQPTQQVTPAEKPETQPAETKQNQSPQQETPPGNETKKQNQEQAIAGEIVLVRNRFGVNWRPLGQGVQITRLSDGPLKRAGLMVGDILLEVDGKTVTDEGEGLEIARDDIFYGKRSEVLIKVLRGEETLFYKLVRGNQ